jgi:hypothetical protein
MSEDDEMAFPLRDDEVFSDSEYESAVSSPSP